MVDVTHPSHFTTVAANNLAARGVSVAEGWLPSGVNNWGRAFMSLIGGMYDDISAQNTVGGSANAITVTSNVPLDALAEGVILAFENTGGPNTAAVTLAVDGLTAKAIRLQGDLALTGGELQDNGFYIVRYDASANGAAGAWILLNPSTHATTFTPGVSVNGSETGITFSSQTGTYSVFNVGTIRLVVGRATIVMTSNGAGTGNVLVTNLPVTAAAANVACVVTPLSGFASLSLGVSGMVVTSSTTIQLRQHSATGSTQLTDTNVTDSASFVIQFAYFAA